MYRAGLYRQDSAWFSQWNLLQTVKITQSGSAMFNFPFAFLRKTLRSFWEVMKQICEEGQS